MTDDLVPSAERINAEHHACEAAARSAVEHAINAGEMLSEVKASLGHGEWLPWLKANFEATPRHAQTYMRLAANKDELSNAKRASHLSIRAAVRELAQTPQTEKSKTAIVDPPWEMVDREEINEWGQQNLLPSLEHDAHLYLWTHGDHLPDALYLADAWGFRYECVLTWIKDEGPILPTSFMCNTEHALFCKRGNLPLMALGKRLDFHAAGREDGRKPEVFYERISEVSPGPHIVMIPPRSRNTQALRSVRPTPSVRAGAGPNPASKQGGAA